MKKMIFVVRKAVEEDIPEILDITKEAFRQYAEAAGINGNVSAICETSEDVREDIYKKECFVALINGVIIGSVRVEIHPDNSAYLSRFGVRSEYQSMGAGSAIMHKVDEAMRELGVSSLYLHTASKILSLIRFYYGQGFYIDSTTKDKGYIRALLCKDYEFANDNLIKDIYDNCAV